MSEASNLSISLVLYRPQVVQLRGTVKSLQKAITRAREQGVLGDVSVDVINNDESHDPLVEEILQPLNTANIAMRNHMGHGNIGFGRAHNLAINSLSSDYHLILNPDVDLSANSLSEGIAYMRSHKEAALVAPRLVGDDGTQLFGCKRYPSVLDFLLRGFAPPGIKRYFQQRLAHYEMHDLPEDSVTNDVPIVSGCFMLFRTSALLGIKGFDERYFLYFEDFDISIRVRAFGEIAYLPMMQVVHHGGNSAKKGLRHIMMFARSGLRFFHSHGWRLL